MDNFNIESVFFSIINMNTSLNNYLRFILLICFFEIISIHTAKLKSSKPPIKIYWNVKSFQCKEQNFIGLLDKYNIIHNLNDTFEGDEITIFYDPGDFPAIFADSLRNGGVPQEGNLTKHLDLLATDISLLTKDANNHGLAIIDHELWNPIFKRNVDKFLAYQTLSKDIERRLHPGWSEEKISKQAEKRFEKSAKIFMKETLETTKKLRPRFSWGYWGFPYCYSNGNETSCPQEVMDQNDELKWLFEASDAFYPYVYLQEAYALEQQLQYIKNVLNETIRIRDNGNKNKNIYAYCWYKYEDTRNFLTQEDLYESLKVMLGFEIHGIIIWGANSDVNNATKCAQVYSYMDQQFGPALETFINIK